MRKIEILNPLQNMADLISKLFHLQHIEIQISADGNTYYDPNPRGKPTIWISIDKDDNFRDVVIHEMAHFLHHQRFSHTALRHTSLYWRILDAVVRKVYPVATLYDWDREYIVGQKFALKRGYITKINRSKK